ncbi:hypothetical protein Leryth_005785 [Lithospermum erythrorhizon]|nr:hypothetical protein Leryth_005785 [Lithospermum erythrorhizon]
MFLIVKEMVDLIIGTSSIDGNPQGATYQGSMGRSHKRLRGKRIIFIGDSLSLNQWQSFTCMLHKALPRAHYRLVRTKDMSNFKFPAYNVSVTLFRSAFFVDIINENSGRVLKLDSMNDMKKWRGRDIMIFNSWHWWLHTGTNQPWDYIQDGRKRLKDMNRTMAFEKALHTWGKLIDKYVDPKKTKVIFQGISPDHANAMAWGNRKARDCRGERKPILDSKYPGGPHPAEVVIRRVLRKMRTPVYLLGITGLSQLRKDGHPSLYGFRGSRGSDCSHWCLPGVPDTWNQLLYAALIQNNF